MLRLAKLFYKEAVDYVKELCPNFDVTRRLNSHFVLFAKTDVRSMSAKIFAQSRQTLLLSSFQRCQNRFFKRPLSLQNRTCLNAL